MSVLQVWYWRQIAIVANLFGQRSIAIEYWERIRAMRPRDANVVATIAHLHAAAGERSQAIGLLREATTLDGSNAATWFNLGFLEQEAGRHDQAIEAFDAAIARDAKLDRAYYGKALSLIKIGRVEQAVPLLRRNIELQPMSPFGFYQLAHAYHRLGDRDKVAGTIKRLAAFEPKVAKQLENETGVVIGVKTGF